jgi:GntR family transcriptional regulator, transcriptional repressor for pyruvate dehydrogenase complex
VLSATAPTARRRLFEAVCDDVRHQMARGFLRPGDKLPAERELAERLGVGRAAVREALRALEASGVLEFRKGVYGGAFIRNASSSGVRASISDMLSLGKISLEHLSETRTSLLTFAARLACERGTEVDFELIEENIARSAILEDGHDVVAMIDAITEFYVLLGNASHNGVLRILIEAVTDVARDLLLKIRPTRTSNLVAVRSKILEALRARESHEAMRLLTEQMAHAHSYVAGQILRPNGTREPKRRRAI